MMRIAWCIALVACGPAMSSRTDAFHSTGTNRFKAFLIFRVGVADIIL
jgi:hypothetical protein